MEKKERKTFWAVIMIIFAIIQLGVLIMDVVDFATSIGTAKETYKAIYEAQNIAANEAESLANTSYYSYITVFAISSAIKLTLISGAFSLVFKGKGGKLIIVLSFIGIAAAIYGLVIAIRVALPMPIVGNSLSLLVYLLLFVGALRLRKIGKQK